MLCDYLEVGGRFKRAGTYVYLWLIHADAAEINMVKSNYPPIKNSKREKEEKSQGAAD